MYSLFWLQINIKQPVYDIISMRRIQLPFRHTAHIHPSSASARLKIETSFLWQVGGQTTV